MGVMQFSFKGATEIPQMPDPGMCIQEADPPERTGYPVGPRAQLCHLSTREPPIEK